MSDKRRLTTDELLARYPHYYKDVRHLEVVDIYRVLELFGVTDPTVQHAVKKLMVPGKRGGKGVAKDLDEALDTLERGAIMREEDLLRGTLSPKPTVVVVNSVQQPSAPAPVPPRDTNRCQLGVCHNRREIGSLFCLEYQVPVAKAPEPWAPAPAPAAPPPPPPPPPAPPQSTVWQAPNPVPEPAVKHKPECTEKVSALVCPCNDPPTLRCEVAPSMPVPTPSLPAPQLPVDGLALAVHNNVNASSPSPLPRC